MGNPTLTLCAIYTTSMKRIYLDWAAAAPVSREAGNAYARAARAFGNPSSPHAEGRAARGILEDARVRIARLASVKPDAVLFTAGATEANALAIVGALRALWDAGRAPERMHALFLPSAHASTQGAREEVESWGVAVEDVPLKDGAIDLARLKACIRPETAFVAVEAVCGETGTIFDVRGTARVLREAQKTLGTRIHLHADAAQLPRIGSFELVRLGADTLSLDAQKVGGMRGIGALIAPRQAALSPLIRGGGQERGLRPGTEAHALASAFAAALETAHEGIQAFSMRAEGMRAKLIAELSAAIPDLLVNGGKEQAPHILNVTLPGRDTEYLVALLDEAGVAVSTRSACATDAEGSVAVRALTGDEDRARETLRISWGHATSPRELSRAAQTIIRAVRFLDQGAI
jgi:cysteine desulfurase